MAQDERFGAALIIEVTGRGRVAVDELDPAHGAYTPIGRIDGAREAATSVPVAGEFRTSVEVQRRFGGMTARALVSAGFTASAGGDLAYAVLYSAPDEEGAGPPVPGHLGGRPLVAGLPHEFAEAVAAAVRRCRVDLPSGLLRVDRAGFDVVGSSAVSFEQATLVLLSVLTARTAGTDVDVAIRGAIEAW